MRIGLIAVGSTGDVQPMVVLGKTIAARGHCVTVTAFEALRPLVVEAGLGFHAIPGDAQRYIGDIIQPGACPLTFLKRMEKALGGALDPLISALYDACLNMDAVVTTFFGSTVYAFADHLGIPLIQSNYCLTDLTGDACLPMMRQPKLGAAFNRATYKLAYRMIGMLEKRYAHPFCRRMNIPVRSMKKGPDYHVRNASVPVLYAFSEHIVPRPPEWGENIHIVGFWEEIVDAYTPSAELSAFLAAGETPIYIGFGSMNSGDMGSALRIVLRALSHTGARAVLSAGWGVQDGVAIPDSVHMLREYVPHQWLFSQVRAVVHHGGAGTTASGLMAGKPSLIVPFGSDQFFWANHVHRLGCGPKPLPRTKLGARSFQKALEDLLQTPDYADNAAYVKQMLARENGLDAAADWIERTIASWPKQPEQFEQPSSF